MCLSVLQPKSINRFRCRFVQSITSWNAFSTSPAKRSLIAEYPVYTTLIVAAASLFVGATVGYKFTPTQVLSLLKSKVPQPGTPEERQYLDKIEKELLDFPLAKKLRADEGYIEQRMWDGAPEVYKSQSLLAGTLSGPGMIAVPGVVFINERARTVVSLIHVGNRLSGFPRIVHGGLIGALLDEALARAAILPLKDKTVVTANLDINYRSPTRTEQIIIIETHVTENTDKKSLVAGTVTDHSGKLLAESTAVFVVPKKYKVSNLLGL
ncbi:HotDog domain-containing protein [Lipomyces arxii]|uniref:HotDog domain-containing protein n=1 Tax=Lipomyces arxii TaxID=56418 RepID=UPI0034CDA581